MCEFLFITFFLFNIPYHFPICVHQDSRLPHVTSLPPPAQENSSSPGARLKTPEVARTSPTVLNASAVRGWCASPAERKSVMSRPAWVWLTPRFLWASWTLTSTTPSPWRHTAAWRCSLARRRHQLIDRHPPALWLHPCSTQVSAADTGQRSDAIYAVAMTDAICEALTALQAELCCGSEINSHIIRRERSNIFHIFLGVFLIPKMLKYSLLAVLRSPKDHCDASDGEELHKLVPLLGCKATGPRPAHPLWTYLPQEGASLSFFISWYVLRFISC